MRSCNPASANGAQRKYNTRKRAFKAVKVLFPAKFSRCFAADSVFYHVFEPVNNTGVFVFTDDHNLAADLTRKVN